jgi:hypothetical protein
MAGTLASSPGASLTPTPTQVALPGNYLGSADFDFLSHELPDTYEKEFERYGNRSISSFLRLVGAESPSSSDLIKWTEQGRLHTKYTSVTSAAAAAADTAVFTVADSGVTACNFRVGQTVFMSSNTTNASNTAIVTAVSGLTFTVAFYQAGGQAFVQTTEVVTCFVYGSEFKKGTNGMQGSLEANSEYFENSPIIIKDKYQVSGSDMAQIGWVEVTSENGASGYLWYIKSEHETRLRFDDYLEMSMVEGTPAEAGSGAIATAGDVGDKGTEGLFYVVGNRGNEWNGGNPSALSDIDAMVERLDKQGSISENVLFTNRQFGFDVDDMLASQNSQAPGGTSYGLFDNDEDMALNLGFSGFKRGYDFYKTDWKYLNDATLRGGLVGGAVNGVMVPAGTMTVYDQVLGQNAKRPFLHVRYRESKAESRKYKTWMTGSAGGSRNSDLDAMNVEFLSERALCTLGANNFFIFKS